MIADPEAVLDLLATTTGATTGTAARDTVAGEESGARDHDPDTPDDVDNPDDPDDSDDSDNADESGGTGGTGPAGRGRPPDTG